ncbi:LacI family DNA-binding transcriptional regulator [Mobiluncus mulieris]|uniref:LacI family transcriptional regulator n=1 Tax=Mobiluncus mulieris TaxID=2052 RepID=A0ABD4TU50_9ACTO|nr:LacI family DNA-binding transcriptional regulator [Mobiluncus mulieris]MCU9968427.1 LacI family transcriptional regulator [Mobiluncus mulieris]MCU9972659.1 LacI family transcriptional regulator [Mobiluncus mulieris]NMX00365.1 LacI family DNA-binding transcriptional regulator [Mobiluncus mulieris]NMX19966.1 LacI family DNA-binding transcriptional regulator [Mobiluncus mulieris]
MPAQRVNIKDVAKQARVGIVTVSRALNGQEGVSDKTRQRIQDIADSLGYRPNRHARFLKLSFNRSIAVVIKGLDNPLFAKILGRMEREIRAHEYLMSIVSVPHWSDELSEAVKIVNEESVSGVVFLGAQYEHRAADMEKLRVPFVVSTVSWMDSAYRERYASVSIDDRGEAGRAVDYLYGLGHRRIALLGSDSLDNSIGSLRLSGYLEAMRRLGLEPQPGWVRSFDATADEPYSFESGYEMTRDLLAQCPEVTAIFAIADVLAIGALRAARESGREVPRDLSIVGFDGIPAGKFVYPSLTTIEQPVEKIAGITCDMLFSQLAGDSPQHVIVPGSLVERGSVARVSPGKD